MRSSRMARDVAQPARRVLQVGFELVERVVERRCAAPRPERQQRRDQPRRAAGVATVHAREQVVEQPHVAGEQPQVAERQQELGVRPSRSASNSASSRTCWPTVSFRSQSGCRTAFTNRSSRRADRPIEHDQQVDVGVEAERPAPVAAERRTRPRRPRPRRPRRRATASFRPCRRRTGPGRRGRRGLRARPWRTPRAPPPDGRPAGAGERPASSRPVRTTLATSRCRAEHAC